jgi:hypothetical protein
MFWPGYTNMQGSPRRHGAKIQLAASGPDGSSGAVQAAWGGECPALLQKEVERTGVPLREYTSLTLLLN